MNFFYCLSFSGTDDDSCMLFRNLAGIFTVNGESIHLEITEKEISAGSIEFHDGLTKTGQLWEWSRTGLEPKTDQSIETHNIEIGLHGPDKMLSRWIIKNAYPISCDADEGQGEVRLNSLELSYTALVKIYP
jgi:hypothetical protein